MLGEADVNHDGCIEYEEFIPVAFRVLVDGVRNKQLENEALASEDGITVLLIDALQGGDPTALAFYTCRTSRSASSDSPSGRRSAVTGRRSFPIIADCGKPGRRHRALPPLRARRVRRDPRHD